MGFCCVAKEPVTAPSYSEYRLYNYFITLHRKQKTEIVTWGKAAMQALFRWKDNGNYSEETTNAFMKSLENIFSTINGRTFDLDNAEEFKCLTENYKVVEVARIKAIMDKRGVEGLTHKFFLNRDLRNDSGLTVREQLYLAKLLIESGKYYVASGDVSFRLRITPLPVAHGGRQKNSDNSGATHPRTP